ncbi:MAG: hypothetical protein KME45_07250 [Stenomitos rutilans HA7619-LM2]|nr:hypothetical protein [Stenomitos rutilans HA7619-LM2]
MNSPDQYAPLKPLETNNGTIASTRNPFWIGLTSLRQHLQQLIIRLIYAQELHVWQCTDRAGRLYWQAYDPVTGRSTSGSEADIRAWIEQLHYLKR